MISPRAAYALVTILATVAGARAQVTIGHLEETIKATRIYAAPNSRCRTYSRVGPYERLIANPGPNGFVKVLLANGHYGYTPQAAVVSLGYKVVAPQPVVPSAEPESRSGDMIARYGLQFQGDPYKMGGTDPSTGIDCSAFVQKLYGDVAGIRLPRTAAEQALVGEPIYRLEDLQSGDRLYFWDAKRRKIGHTGVYVGGGYFVHSSHGRGGVATTLLTRSWRAILVAARR